MNLKSKIENRIESLRTSILKCSVEQKFLRAYFLKLSFNLMLCALKLWKKRESQNQPSNVSAREVEFENYYGFIKKFGLGTIETYNEIKQMYSIGLIKNLY